MKQKQEQNFMHCFSRNLIDNIVYSEEIHKYIDSMLSGRSRPLNRRCRGKYTKSYEKFIEFCKYFDVDIDAIFPDEYTFMDIINCIKKNSGPRTCNCGTPIRSNFKWCSWKCRSADKTYRKSISEMKTKLYQDSEWKTRVEGKKVETCLENHGVKYPMQDVGIFEKQQASCFEKDENGLHGYEPYVYGFLKQLYPELQNGTTYLKDNSIVIRWLGNDNKEHRSYPDFFIPEMNTFIEVKSDYTRKLHNEKLIFCKKELYNMKYGYIICVVKPNKQFAFELGNTKYIL